MTLVTRSYCYRAYPEESDVVWLLEVMRRMKQAHRDLIRSEDLTSDLKRVLEDIWWPNRELVREWVRTSKLTRKIPRAPRPGGVIAGVSQIKGDDAWQVLQASRQVAVEQLNERDCLLTMPVTRERDVTFRFRKHRPFPPKAELVRWLLVAEPREEGKYCWSVQFSLKFEVADPVPVAERPRIGGVDIGWRKVPDGFRVAILAVGERTHFYVLPWHDVYNQPKKDLSDTQLRQFRRWRLDHYRKIGAAIARECDVVKVEHFMLSKLRSSGLTKEARQHVSPSLLTRCIREAIENVGKQHIPVRAHRTSTDCSMCGEGSLARSAALIWRCQQCDGEIDHDMNAARNIAKKEAASVEEARLPWKRKAAVALC